MMDFSKFSDEKLEQEMLQAKDLLQRLQNLAYHNFAEEEKRQWKERRNKLDGIIKLLDQERCRRTIKNVDQFFSRLEGK